MISFPEEDVNVWRTQWEGLTPSEQGIVDLIADGFTVDEIVVRRSVSASTVRSQIRNALTKFDLHSQIQLVARVWQVRYDDLRRESS